MKNRPNNNPSPKPGSAASRKATRLVTGQGLHGRTSKGMALISVLLVVALAVSLATGMINQQTLLIHQTLNQFDQSQALQYALGGEEIARQILHEDTVSGSPVDLLSDVWAEDILPFEYPEGEVKIQITDLQSCLNLNALMAAGNPGIVTELRLKELISNLSLDVGIVDRLKDYMDDDDTARPLGAEDYEYLGLEVPYRTSSQLLAETSELRVLFGLEGSDYAQLEPYVCVLPDPMTPINVNTASPGVLQSLSGRITADQAIGLVDYRDYDEGFDDVDEFLRQLTASGGGTLDRTGLSVNSFFFMIQVQARYNQRISRLTSLVQRNHTNGRLKVISRDLGKSILWRPVDQSLDAQGDSNPRS